MYSMPVAFLRRPAASALYAVTAALMPMGYGLKVFDGYRPYSVTVAFWEAYHDSTFVASPYTGSRHNRGCAVDLTLIDLASGREVEMPTPFDAFTLAAGAHFGGASAAALAHRTLLQKVMTEHGFQILESEWWHFDFAGWRDFPVTDIPFEDLAGPVFYNVRDYGASGDGRTLDHKDINLAIDACARAGGGTVYFPAGTYLCGSIHLRSHVHLLIDAGATILGGSTYDPAEEFPDSAYQDGGHTYFHNSLIWGEHLTDVSITGKGRIDGGGLTKEDREVGEGSIGAGDKAIALKLCSDVLIRDVTIVHGGHFAILLTGCDLVTLDNLTIDTNRDGIDLDGCTNSLVSHCRVNSPDDDAICPKSSYALGKPRITENLVISDCQVSGFAEGSLVDGTLKPLDRGWSTGRIKFGTESNGGFRNCVVANCTFRNCQGLALEEVDGGTMDNIIVSNLVMENINGYPIYVTLGERNRGPYTSTHTGVARNIYIRNVSVLNADSVSGIQLTGSPGHPLEHVELQNIWIQFAGGGTAEQAARDFPELSHGYPEPGRLGITPSYGLFARHVKGLLLDNVTFATLTPDQRPAVLTVDVTNLTTRP